MLTILIRSYYERYGSFDGIENSSFFYLIKNEIKRTKCSLSEFLYRELGYTSDVNLNSEGRYNVRKLYMESNVDVNKINELNKILNVTKDRKLIDRLQPLDCIGTEIDYYRLSDKYDIPLGEYESYMQDKQFANIVKVYSRYLRDNQSVKIILNNKEITLGDLIKSIARLINFDKMEETMSSAVVVQALGASSLKLKKAAVDVPMIVGKNLVVPRIEGRDYNKDLIVEMAFYDSIFAFMTIPISRRDALKELLLKNYYRNSITDEEYLEILDFAHVAGCTVNELCEWLVVPQAFYDDMFEDMGALVTPADEKSLRLIVQGIPKNQSAEFISNVEFKYLYEKDLIKLIRYENGKYMLNGESLFDMLGGGKH